MKILAASDDKKLFTMSHKAGKFEIHSGLSFNCKGYFITKEPITEEVTVIM
jgi:hypothetical protein